jgi:hypothetical protein
VPLFILALLSYYFIAQNLTELSLQHQQAEATLAATALKERIDRVFDVGRTFSTHPQIRAAVLRSDWKTVLLDLEIMSKGAGEPFVDTIFLADPSGTLVSSFPETGNEGQNFSYRDWYRGIMDTGKPYLSETYERAIVPKYNVVVVAIPIVDDKNQLAAILALQIRLDHFLEWSRSIDLGPRGFIYVVDQRGHVVSHPLARFQKGIADLSGVETVKKVLRGERGVEITSISALDSQNVVAYEPIPGFGWGVIIEQPASEAFASRNRILSIFVILYALVFTLNIFFTYLIYRIIVRYQARDGATPSSP